jgi:hypothetical protein
MNSKLSDQKLICGTLILRTSKHLGWFMVAVFSGTIFLCYPVGNAARELAVDTDMGVPAKREQAYVIFVQI